MYADFFNFMNYCKAEIIVNSALIIDGKNRMETYVLATISLNQMAGGLERNIIRLANNLARSGRNVELITFDFSNATSFYEIDKAVHWHKVAISVPHGPINFFDRIKLILKIRQILKNSNARLVICFHHGILFRFMMAAFFTKTKIVASERNSLELYKYIKLSKWNANFLLMYFVKKITVQFESYVSDYPRPMQKHIVHIPNAVFPVSKFSHPGVPTKEGKFVLLSVGRLCQQKNYAALIKAFSKLSPQFPEWDLVIVGEGGGRTELEDIIANEGLHDKVLLPGAFDNVEKWYSSSHLFCLPSRWEGFPNSLAEALSHGLPAVVYSECAGCRDMVTNGENGFLAVGNGDVVSLQHALYSLMSDGNIRKRMGAASAKSVKCYHPDEVFPLWETMLDKIEK